MSFLIDRTNRNSKPQWKGNFRWNIAIWFWNVWNIWKFYTNTKYDSYFAYTTPGISQIVFVLSPARYEQVDVPSILPRAVSSPPQATMNLHLWWFAETFTRWYLQHFINGIVYVSSKDLGGWYGAHPPRSVQSWACTPRTRDHFQRDHHRHSSGRPYPCYAVGHRWPPSLSVVMQCTNF